MDWIMLIDNMNGIALDGKLDVECSTTIVHGRRVLSIRTGVHFSVADFMRLDLSQLCFTMLDAILADVLESGAVTTLLVLSRTFNISKAIHTLYGVDYRPVKRELLV